MKDTEPAFTHWSRLWNIYHNKQLLTTLRELALHRGLKVRPSTFPPLARFKCRRAAAV